MHMECAWPSCSTCLAVYALQTRASLCCSTISFINMIMFFTLLYLLPSLPLIPCLTNKCITHQLQNIATARLSSFPPELQLKRSSSYQQLACMTWPISDVAHVPRLCQNVYLKRSLQDSIRCHSFEVDDRNVLCGRPRGARLHSGRGAKVCILHAAELLVAVRHCSPWAPLQQQPTSVGPLASQKFIDIHSLCAASILE